MKKAKSLFGVTLFMALLLSSDLATVATLNRFYISTFEVDYSRTRINSFM